MGDYTIEELLDRADTQFLTDWEQGFVDDLRERFDQYGERTHLTDNQRAKLEQIAFKD